MGSKCRMRGRQLTGIPPTPVMMGTATPVMVTDAQATTMPPIPVKAIPEPLMPVPVMDIPMLPPMVESQLGGSSINNLQGHQDSSNISMCSSDLDEEEILKSHFNDRLSDKVYTTVKELFSNVNIDSVHEILPKINEYSSEIAKFAEDINIKYGISLNYTQLKVSEIKHWAETFQVVANTSSQPGQQQLQVPQLAVAVQNSQTPTLSLREQWEEIDRLTYKAEQWLAEGLCRINEGATHHNA